MNADRNSSPKRPWTSVLAQGPIFRPSAAAAYFGVALSTYYELIAAASCHLHQVVRSLPRERRPKVWLDAAIAARAARVENK